MSYICSAIAIDGNQKPNQMIQAFQIFKEGKTADWITILIPEKMFSESLLQKKIEFYISLGYSVKSIK